ncbi:autophagy-related protein 16-1-like [Ostrea edulis]|uniref:autophagy-related protein 16-1-like n=1 Tax=Ostrea edulis TaxID=37623 RepID=UPI0024AE900A|nr:autophagy-related protein 16-1-like [Ostrea edulis]XP_056004695.1 autophagy-related protein 16-1-like [Ostrea edulis]
MDPKDLHWKHSLLEQLRHRDQKEKVPFESLIASHWKHFEYSQSLKSKNVQLTVETEKLKEENFGLQIKVEQGGGGSGGNNQALEQKLFKLQEEVTELHRRRGENTQQIIDLNNLLQEKEKELHGRDDRLNDLLANELSLKMEIKNLESTIMELEATNQMLKDEHQALQLTYTGLEEKYRKVEKDNQQLLERWIRQQAKMADQLNAENDQFMLIRQQKLRKELEDAARENVQILPERQSGVYVPTTIPICLSASLPTKAQYKFDAHEGDVNAIRWSPSGSMFATGGADRKIKLWEVINGKCESKGILTGSNAGIMALDFDLEENSILGASNDFASRVWSLTDLRVRHTLTGHSGKVLAAKFLGDSSKVVSGSHDRTLKIWDLHSRSCVKTIFAGSSCNDLVTIHGTNILSGHFDKRVRFWDSRTDSSTNEILLQGRLTSLDLSPDKMNLLCCTRDDTIKVLDLRMNQVSTTLAHDDFKVGCDWSRAVFSPDTSYAVAGSSDGAVFIWNIKRGRVEKILKEHAHSVIACSWHPVGSYVLSCEKQRKTILWSDI